MDFFEEKSHSAPLAERMRPKTLEEYVGQEHILASSQQLGKILLEEESDRMPSFIFWGPPGTGKTTLARLIARKKTFHFETLSAVSSGVKDIKMITETARNRLRIEEKRTVLFVDEIHRFNKAQQDAFLPAIEAGWIILLGATTENPSFELNNALLSRTQVLVLKSIGESDLKKIFFSALVNKERGIGDKNISLTDEALDLLSNFAAGDARRGLNLLESLSFQFKDMELSAEQVNECIKSQPAYYDRKSDLHYDLISALHKSIRNSNPQSALYYLARMLVGGENPMYIARRLVRAASEDVGIADPQALSQAMAAKEAVHFVGTPESDVILAQVVVYLSCAPKSNSIYEAIGKAKATAQKTQSVPVPAALKNAPTKLMKDLGYGQGYQYDHNYKNKVSFMDTMPAQLKGQSFYKANEIGFEREIKKRLHYIQKMRQESADS